MEFNNLYWGFGLWFIRWHEAPSLIVSKIFLDIFGNFPTSVERFSRQDKCPSSSVYSYYMSSLNILFFCPRADVLEVSISVQSFSLLYSPTCLTRSIHLSSSPVFWSAQIYNNFFYCRRRILFSEYCRFLSVSVPWVPLGVHRTFSFPQNWLISGSACAHTK